LEEVTPLPPRARSVNDFLNPGMKYTEFHLKINDILGLKPYIRSL